MRILGDGPPIKSREGKNVATYQIECDCGTVFVVRKYAIHSGNTKSCGCLRRTNTAARGKANKKLGISTDPAMMRTYASWRSMIGRCYQPTNAAYKQYGGVGVLVVPEWRDFYKFFADMGVRPGPEYSLDRIDGSKGYSLDNCRWATRAEQARNRKSTVFITFNGVTLPATDWATKLRVSITTVLRRNKRNQYPNGEYKE